MGDLTKNLSRSEFACPDKCGLDTVDVTLVKYLQEIVDHFSDEYGERASIIITSGNRCKAYNDKLRELYFSSNGKFGANTAVNSQHIYSRAADFKIKVGGEYIDRKVFYDYIDSRYGNKVALGIYSNRCHMDTRTNAGQRW